MGPRAPSFDNLNLVRVIYYKIYVTSAKILIQPIALTINDLPLSVRTESTNNESFLLISGFFKSPKKSQK